jgi:beta-lactamase regulating signal transducer with metallopeptidase domain
VALVGSESWLWWVGERLLSGSVQGAFVVALVWLVCRSIPAIPASARTCLWWLASLKLALALVPVPSLPIPLLPPAADDVVAVGRSLAADSLPPPASSTWLPSLSQAPTTDPASPVTPAPAIHVGLTVAIGLWLAGVAALTLHLFRVYARLRGAVRSSTPIGAEDADVADRLARVLGLRKTPDVRVSDGVTTPLVAGLFRPTVLIPAQALATLSPGERAMAICHEFAHVRRRDLLLGWVPALAERLFFFHPLARLAAREYVVAREAACDTLVLRAMDVAPQEYGRMLVRLGVGGLDPAFMAAGSSPSISSLRRRLDMLHHLTFTGSRSRVIWLFVAVLALTLVPLRLVARAPLQPQVPSTAAPALAGVEAEQATAPSPVQEIAQTTPAAPRESTDAFLALATEDARRQAEAAYRKAVEAEYERTALLEGTADFLKKEYETKLEEYKAALVDFAGNQEPGEANQARQQALALQQTEVEQLRRKLEDVERTMRAVAEARQKAEQAGQDDAAARVARLNEVMRTLREQVGARETQAGGARTHQAVHCPPARCCTGYGCASEVTRRA